MFFIAINGRWAISGKLGHSLNNASMFSAMTSAVIIALFYLKNCGSHKK